MTTPLLQLENITKHFGGVTAVKDVSLPVFSGEILGLIGPNGAGKTTLFNMISGAFLPSEGTIYFNGEDITPLPAHRICQLRIGRTFQIARPFAKLSVIDNIKVGSFLHTHHPGKAEAKAREIADFVGLTPYADHPAQTLTTAGRKRLELARALSTEPTLLLLDEVMAGLTPTESVGIVKLIHEVRDRGMTLLVIEHVMKALMSVSDRVAVLHHGELIAVDVPATIAQDEQVVEAYLGEEFHFVED